MKRKKGISPLVSTMILITAAVIGGMLVFNYFQGSVNQIAASSQAVTVDAKSIYTDNGKVVYIAVTNIYNKRLQLDKIVFLDSNGNNISSQAINTSLEPGGKYTYVGKVPAHAQLVLVEYHAGTAVMKSPPVKIP